MIAELQGTIVRDYVSKYTGPAAEVWKRSKGATEAAARRCIKDGPTLPPITDITRARRILNVPVHR